MRGILHFKPRCFDKGEELKLHSYLCVCASEILFKKWLKEWRVIRNVLNRLRRDEYLKIDRELVLEKKLPVLGEEYFCLHCEYHN